jgi:hypothetical protein
VVAGDFKSPRASPQEDLQPSRPSNEVGRDAEGFSGPLGTPGSTSGGPEIQLHALDGRGIQ